MLKSLDSARCYIRKKSPRDSHDELAKDSLDVGPRQEAILWGLTADELAGQMTLLSSGLFRSIGRCLTLHTLAPID